MWSDESAKSGGVIGGTAAKGSRPGRSTTATGELIARMQRGEYEAERRLFERFAPRLRDRARRDPRLRKVGHWSPDDVLQEVFFRALSGGRLSLYRERPSTSLEKALLQMLDRVFNDELRRKRAKKRGGRRVTEGGEAIAAQFEIRAHGAPTVTAAAADVVERCRRILDPAEWELFEMREIRDFSVAEIARRFGISDAAVRGRLHRARKKLLESLGSEIRP